VLCNGLEIWFSVFVVLHVKAQCAGNGRPLGKHCNAAVECHESALRVGFSASLDGVAPLAKGAAIAGEARPARNADKPTESDF